MDRLPRNVTAAQEAARECFGEESPLYDLAWRSLPAGRMRSFYNRLMDRTTNPITPEMFRMGDEKVRKELEHAIRKYAEEKKNTKVSRGIGFSHPMTCRKLDETIEFLKKTLASFELLRASITEDSAEEIDGTATSP